MSKDRVVVVTGAGSGIGLGIARRFAENGHPVAMLDRDLATVRHQAEKLIAEGLRVIPLSVDVSERAQVDQAYTLVRQQLGPVSIVVANAGISEARAFVDTSVEQWQRMIDVNLSGVFHTVQSALSDMIANQWGRIVTISSQAGQSGAPNRAHYAASKAGVIGLTKALGMELARTGITVNTIPPALVATPMMERETERGEFPGIDVVAPMIPIGRAATPDDIADACEFLCSDKAGYITGQQINVNGGSYI